MRRSHRLSRGGFGAHEFGGSGEDSFVAVVVTKLTGALLFILLLTMVIMALIPRGHNDAASALPPALLTITTPAVLPSAVKGQPYQLAFAAVGASGSLRWSAEETLPEGFTLEPATGIIQGVVTSDAVITPENPEGANLFTIIARDGSRQAKKQVRLPVMEAAPPAATADAAVVTAPTWDYWLRRGFGFLILVLVYFLGMSCLTNLQRWSGQHASADPEHFSRILKRFQTYRHIIRVCTLILCMLLAGWLWLIPVL